MKHTITSIAFVCLLCSLAAAAPPSGQDILRRAFDMSAAVRDYTADVDVAVDMPNVKMPERRARVYFKRPDKVAIDSRGIVMIPKQALVPGNIGSELMKNAQVTLAGTKTQGGVSVYFLKVIPAARKHGDDKLLLWVRGDRFTVERMEAYSAGKQQMAVTWEHQLVAGKYWLPRRLVATLTASRSDFPHGPPDLDKKTAPPKKPGTITVVFYNIRVNTGLKDSLFVEKSEGKGK